MDVRGRAVLVVGLARSGIAASRFLARLGARVVATDLKPPGELSVEALSLASHGVSLEVGGHHEASFRDAELVVVSPGVSWDLPQLAIARRSGAEVIAELELGFRFLPGEVVAVTGTKGKSTTTAALGAMLREAGREVRVGGNIGEAVTGLLDGATEATVFALEVSSFQLEGVVRFRPRVAVFLNLTPDHLDRHPDLGAYAAAKARVFAEQREGDFAVVNGDSPEVVELARSGRARLVTFHPLGRPEQDDVAFFDSGQAILRRDGRNEPLFSREMAQLPGAHLQGDLLAAATAARLLGAEPKALARAVARFSGAEHVLERVAEIDGVRFFNDSKATNVDAVRNGLLAFDGPVLLIMGGRYKGGDFASLGDVVAGRVKTLFSIGEARERIAAALAPATPIVACPSLREAVQRAFAAGSAGDTVLLAPGCSSFDMFRDYAERGRAFKAEVRRLSHRERP
jgi:UDP-N-acetylmuramoylalanine--D-glutamate ligase